MDEGTLVAESGVRSIIVIPWSCKEGGQIIIFVILMVVLVENTSWSITRSWRKRSNLMKCWRCFNFLYKIFQIRRSIRDNLEKPFTYKLGA